MLDKTYTPAALEERQYDEWERAGAFASDVASNRAPYTIMMPPPNVTGSLHMGHALTMTLQDVLIRHQRRLGRDALWQPGTDHAGIATQMVVERNLAADGIGRLDLGRPAFVEKVWEWKAESGGRIVDQLRRLGCSPDWPRARFTMDEGLSHAVRRVFVELYRQGLIYRDKRLVNWDPKLHTAISDLEVEPRPVDGKLWHLRYPLADDPRTTLTVATTRPETMLGDTAVAVHPDDPRYAALIGRHVRLPIVDRLIPIVADDYADPEQGSGAVKITPAHDFNDFEVGRRHGLAMINIFDRDARVLVDRFEVHGGDAEAPDRAVPEGFGGLDRYAARTKVVAAFEAAGLLEKIDPHAHTVPHGDRSGVAIEPWLTDQWYCNAAVLAAPAIRAVEEGRTRFVPKTWEKTYFDWMRNIQPWCISRQLWWGHQIPAWYAPGGEVFVAETQAEALAAAEAALGPEVTLRRDEDVLDTWFSSALWPFSTLGWPDETPALTRYYPGDVLVTGFDIIFFWVARMMMMGLHFMGDVPFATVYIHALVRDAQGQKMSKAKGNVIDPLDLVDQYGADALRMTLVSMAAQGRDINISPDRVAGYRNFATKLWNAARYCQMNDCRPVHGFDPASVTAPVNRWIVGEAAALRGTVDQALDGYRFNEAAGGIYQFAWATFCDWYLEFTKPLLADADAGLVAETRATTAWVLDRILELLNPIMPYLTETLWASMGDGEDRGRLIDAVRPTLPDGLGDPAAAAEMDWVVRLVSTIRTVRAEMNVPPSAALTLLVRDGGPETRRRLDAHGPLITRLARLEAIAETAAVPGGAAQAVLDEATLILPLADVIDLARERERLGREIAKVEAEIAKIEAKLANPNFRAKAPDTVVAEQQTRRDGYADIRDRLAAALARVEG